MFTEDITGLEVCLDISTPAAMADNFEGFRFTEASGTTQVIKADCNQWFDIPLSGRLIGFHVRTRYDHRVEGQNIRSIAAIVDTHTCGEEEIPAPDGNPVKMMSSYINDPPVTQDLTDVTNSYTTTLFDGQICVGFTKIIYPASPFLSLSADGLTLTL